MKPVFNFDKAKVILSLDCDFLGGEDDAHNHIRKFAASRKASEGMSRLYAVESLFTLTGANADHRLRVPASSVVQFGVALLAAIDSSHAVNGFDKTVEIDAKWIAECANDLKAAGGKALVVAGQRQPLIVHLARARHQLGAGRDWQHGNLAASGRMPRRPSWRLWTAVPQTHWSFWAEIRRTN